jgi:2'-5' RNA ligase
VAGPLRLFVAIDPAPAVRERIARELEALRPLARARWVNPDAMHVTLAFLGSVDGDLVPAFTEVLRGVGGRHAPLDVSFAGAGAFGGRKPRVVWIGVKGDVERLAEIQRDVVNALVPLGHEAEDRLFSAHLTLARARDPRGDPTLIACAAAIRDIDFGPTRVEEIVLYRSDLSPKGPRYTALARLPLGG